MSYLVISSSLNPESRSRVLAQDALKALKDTGVETQWLDLADYSLPLCDGHTAYDEPQVQEVKAFVHKAEGILLAVPIYNFDANAAAKNLIELTGSSWSEKVVGFLCAAGGARQLHVHYGTGFKLDAGFPLSGSSPFRLRHRGIV